VSFDLDLGKVVLANFSVAPAEMEALLLQHPAVVDVGVVGVWDESQASELPR
jgi:acyl-coenzyme A synthetase/AMP-(fatty) acid ligase